jgi:hypothetical protein
MIMKRLLIRQRQCIDCTDGEAMACMMLGIRLIAGVYYNECTVATERSVSATT